VKNISVIKRAAFCLFVIILLSVTLSANAFTAGETLSYTAPNDGQDYAFSVPVRVNETEPYAGIQFKLVLTSGEYLSHTFAVDSAVAAKGARAYKAANDPNQFGFWHDANAFSGDITVGTLNIVYKGNAPQAIYITEMKIVRIDGKDPIGIVKDSPIHTISVSRVAGENSHTVTFDPAGGIRTGGGELVQTVPDGSAASAPILSRSDYTFKGWDKAFDNVTADITVIAQWSSNGNPDVEKPDKTPSGNGSGSQTTDDNATVADDDTPLAEGFPFEDVHESDWFCDDIKYVYGNGLMNGIEANIFSPKTSLTRGMIVTILGRATDVEQSEYPSCAFDDVGNEKYYSPYIEWGRQKGIVLGVGDNRFEPDRALTRQELTTILYRYAGLAGLTLPETRAYVEFSDETEINEYAKGPVAALYSAGVIDGKPDNLFDPKGTATRAEAAAMFHRFLTTVKT
jgi:hypothetical protein